jgi:hypothetical protein
MDIDYIITGEFDQIAAFMLPVMKESRFLSDTPNVKEFTWYPVTHTTQAVELSLTTRPTDEEIAFLAREYRSLTFGVMEEQIVDRLISEDGVEVL